jgi:hypothetical protein
MFTFSNLFVAAVTAGLSFCLITQPTLTYAIWNRAVSLAMATYTLNQWAVLAVLVLYLKAIIALTFRRSRVRTRWNGREYIAQGLFNRRAPHVAQAIGTTGEAGAHNGGSESNQSHNVGLSNERSLTLQTQVSPGMNEEILLPKAVKELPYSTPMYLGQFAVTSSLTAGSSVFSLDSTSFYANNNFKRLFIDRRFCKYDVRFTINVTGNKSATGLVACAVLPHPPIIPGSAIQQDTGLNPAWSNLFDRVLSSNHTIVDLSDDSVHYLDMPYMHYASYLSTFTYASQPAYASLEAIVLSPYLPATGQTTAINFEVYATLINIEHVETAPYVAQSLISFGGTETTNVVNTIENMNDSTLPVNVSGDHISASVPMPVGLDNAPDTRNNEGSFLRMAYQKLMSWRNVVDVHKASPAPQIVETFTKEFSDDIRVGTDEMSMDFFRGRWFSPTPTFTNYSVSTSTATGARLFALPITPCPIDANYSAGGTIAGDFSLWMTGLFRYWSGSMKYRLLVASNMFKQGKILVCVNYGASVTTAPATLAPGAFDPRSVHHLIIDLANSDRIIDVDIPYKAIFEKLRTPRTQGLGTASPIEAETSLGFIAAYVISPLQVSNNTASTVNVALLQAWGKDFNFYTPMQVPDVGWCSQAKLEIDGNVTLHKMNHMLEPFSNLKQLASTLPSTIGTYMLPYTLLSDGKNVQPICIPIHPIFQCQDPLWSALTCMYSGMKGSYRAVLRFANVPTGISLRVQYFDSLIATKTDNTFLDPTTGGNENYDLTVLAGVMNSTLSASGGYTNALQMDYLPQLINPSYTNTITGATTPGYLVRNGLPPIGEFIVDPYSQPEVIVEVPDPSPIYRTQQVRGIQPGNGGYPLGASGKYQPFFDRNIGWLVISPLDYHPNFGASESPIMPDLGSVTVSFMAGDDFRAFWYNGGPTAMSTNQCSYVKPGATAPSVFQLGVK